MIDPPPIDPGLPRTAGLPNPRNRVFRLLRRPARRLMHRIWDIKIHGSELLPPRGPMILVANHVGVIDGPLMVLAHPQPTYALAKIELFSGWLGRALSFIGQIPIDRRRIDVRALTRSIQLLRSGGIMTIFPEGRRTGGQVQTIHGGAAYLAMVTGAAVVPVALLGTREPGQTTAHIPRYGAPVHLCYGAPIRVPAVPWPRTKIAVREWTETIRQTLAAHIIDAQETTGMELPGPPKPRAVTTAGPRRGIGAL